MIVEAMKYYGVKTNGKLELMTYYNHHCFSEVKPSRRYRIQPNDDWCAMFTTVIAHKCGIGSESFPYEVSVWYQAEIAKSRGRWFTDVKSAKPNDLIVFDWGKGNRYNHVGFVTNNEHGVIRTVEGNKDNTVSTRKVKHGSSSIKGFIRTHDLIAKRDVLVGVDERILLLAIDTALGLKGDGEDRKRVLGGDYRMVQDVINSRITR